MAHRRLPGKAGGRRDDGCLGLEREHPLFSGSVRDNIAYGETGPADPRRVEQAARLADADSFIRQLPNGYDTDVGAAGALLEKLFEGSAEKLFAALLGSKRLSKDELARLEAMVAAAQEEEQP